MWRETMEIFSLERIRGMNIGIAWANSPAGGEPSGELQLVPDLNPAMIYLPRR
jgi:hypothetical protein